MDTSQPRPSYTPPRDEIKRLLSVVEAQTLGQPSLAQDVLAPMRGNADRAIRRQQQNTNPENLAMVTTLHERRRWVRLDRQKPWITQDHFLAANRKDWQKFLTKEHNDLIVEITTMLRDLKDGLERAGRFDRANEAEPGNEERALVRALQFYLESCDPVRLLSQNAESWQLTLNDWERAKKYTTIDGYEGALAVVGTQFNHNYVNVSDEQRVAFVRAAVSRMYRTGRKTFSESVIEQRRNAKNDVINMRQEIDAAVNALSSENVYGQMPRIQFSGHPSREANAIAIPAGAVTPIRHMLGLLTRNMESAIRRMHQDMLIQRSEDGRQDLNQNYLESPVYKQARVAVDNVNQRTNSLQLLNRFVRGALGTENLDAVTAWTQTQLQDMLDKEIYVKAGGDLSKTINKGSILPYRRRKVENQHEELTGKMLVDCHILLQAIQRVQAHNPEDGNPDWDSVLGSFVERMKRTTVTKLFNQRINPPDVHLNDVDRTALNNRFPDDPPTLELLVLPKAAPNTSIKGEAFRLTHDGSVLIEERPVPANGPKVHVVPSNLAAITLSTAVMGRLKNNPDQPINVQFTLKASIPVKAAEKIKRMARK